MSSSSSSNIILPLASTSLLLLLLLLIPSLNLLITNGLNSISPLVTCLFFKAPLCVIVSFLKGLNLPLQALLKASQALADAFKDALVYLIQTLLGILGSFFMALLEFVNNNVGVLESAFGGLLEKGMASWEGSLFEQVRGVVKSGFEIVFGQVLEIGASSAGSLFDFAKTTFFTLLSKPGSAIGELVETLKGSLEGGSSTEGVRGIVGSFIEKVVNTGLGVASSSTIGSFEILKSIFGLMVDFGYSIGGLVEKTRAALEVLKMKEVREIVKSIGKILVNMIITYLLG